MKSHTFSNRFRRLFRRRKKQITAVGQMAEDQLERNVMRRFGHLRSSARFVAGWMALVLLLGGCVVIQTRSLTGYYQSMQPAPGGIYSEGMVDTYTNANPLYASGMADDTVSKLLFAGLFKYDAKNRLVGDLADSWHVDDTGKRYTVRLKPHLTWQDGRPLTADDVAFTYHTIQNPDVQSPLSSSWRDVVITSPDPSTVVFELPNPLSSFPYSLTTGIIPQHVLRGVDAAHMRSARFNTVEPIGAGPFKLKTIEVNGNSPANRQQEIALVPFDGYYGGAPKISSFIVRTYPDENSLLKSFRDHTTTAMVGEQALPADLQKDTSVQQLRLPLTAANMVFFKTTAGVLQDAAVRQALVAAADINELAARLPHPVLPVRSPLLQSSPGYNPAYQQHYEGAAKAGAMLDAAGWRMQPDGVRTKAGQRLAFKLYAQDTPEFRIVTQGLRQQWKAAGADVQVVLQSVNDLHTTVSGIGGAGAHNYDALLYGISLGVDPDEYVYWDSKQADIRSSQLNFSEYKSAEADAALEAGRTRSDLALRTIKYQPFLQAWQRDAPALGLYQPCFNYVVRGQVYGLDEHVITQGTDRFNNVEHWMIRRTPQPIAPSGS